MRSRTEFSGLEILSRNKYKKLAHSLLGRYEVLQKFVYPFLHSTVTLEVWTFFYLLLVNITFENYFWEFYFSPIASLIFTRASANLRP